MRHRKSGRQLNRNSSHRKAMFRNMACSLIEHEVIRTTVPKAKELRRVAEPLITLAKSDSVANRRLAFSRMRSKAAVGKLFSKIGPRYQERPGVIPEFSSAVLGQVMRRQWRLWSSLIDRCQMMTMMTLSRARKTKSLLSIARTWSCHLDRRAEILKPGDARLSCL